MNILHLQLSGNPGGVVTLCRTISAHSQNRNFNYFIFSGGTVAEAIEADGGIIYVANTNRYMWKKSLDDFCEYCKKNEIDVIINHSSSPIACMHALKANKVMPSIKLIMYLHGAAENIIPQGKKNWIYRWFVKKYEKKSDVVVAISEFVKRSCMTTFGIKEEKILVIHNGVDYNKFSSYYKVSQRDVMNLIYVGRLIPEKGVNLLIDAIKLIENNVKAKVIIVGDGIIKSELEEKVKSMNMSEQIKIVGTRMDIPEVLKDMDYFVHPAICNEGFGITLIESMSAGVPCVAFDKGAIPEIISDNINGFIVRETTAEALAEKLLECYNLWGSEQYLRMKCSAQETGRRFDIFNMIQKLESLYL